MTRSNNVLCGLAVTMVCGLLLASRADAVIVNVDFNTPAVTAGTFTGNGVAAHSAGTWNAITPGLTAFTSGPLLDSTGAATTVTISLTDAHNQYDTTNDVGLGTHTATFAKALLDDYAFAPDPASFTISGLVSGASYDLYIYSQNGGYYSQKSKFTIGADVEHVNNTVAGVGSGFVLHGNYVAYIGLIATGGSISGTWAGDLDTGINGTFNGFQILPTPEPTSMALLAAAGPLLLRRAKRRAV